MSDQTEPGTGSPSGEPETDGDAQRRARLHTRAYALWEADGRPDGRHDEHWRQAEAEDSTGGGSAPEDQSSPEASSAVRPSGSPRASKPAAPPPRAARSEGSKGGSSGA